MYVVVAASAVDQILEYGNGSSCVGGGYSLIKVNDVIQQHAAELMYSRDRPSASGDAARLARIRYLAVLFVGAVLLALIAQMLLNGGTITFKGVLQIGLIGVLAPGVVFIVNHEEAATPQKAGAPNRAAATTET